MAIKELIIDAISFAAASAIIVFGIQMLRTDGTVNIGRTTGEFLLMWVSFLAWQILLLKFRKYNGMRAAASALAAGLLTWLFFHIGCGVIVDWNYVTSHSIEEVARRHLLMLAIGLALLPFFGLLNLLILFSVRAITSMLNVNSRTVLK
jgi:hypothetical protein